MTADRRRVITINALQYIATHMEAVLDADPGPHCLVDTAEEDAFLMGIFNNEADKIRARADRILTKRNLR